MFIAASSSFVSPSTPTTVAFVVICLCVAAAIAALHLRTHKGARARGVIAGVAVGWLALTFGLAASGALEGLTGSPRIGLFPIAANLFALALALSPAGKRVAAATPVAWLVGLQAFRLPLEVVLHRWHAESALPIQMTWSGDNFDVITGIAALVVGLALLPSNGRTRLAWPVVGAFNLLGLVMLVRVASIALRSIDWPMKSDAYDLLELPLHAPYAWLVSVCVAGALWGHIVLARWLYIHRRRPRAQGSGG